MGLDSGLFEIIMVVAAAASLAVVVWLWPKAAGQHAAHLAARLGLIAGSQLLVIVTFLICLNGYFGFYGSWAQLLGGTSPSTVAAAAARPGAAGGPSDGQVRSLVVNMTEPGPVPGGQVLPAEAPRYAAAGPGLHRRRVTVHGQPQYGPVAGSGVPGLSGLSKRVSTSPAVVGRLLMVSMTGQQTGITARGAYVYLPPQYFQRAYAHARFPAVLALTGYPGASWSIVKRLGLPSEAARLVAAGRMPPAIYVMMNVSVVMPRDTECTNVPAGPQVESFFAQDVPRAIEQSFRVQRLGSAWGLIGYSTGGYCAAKLAMLNPYQFHSAVSLAGYYVALRDNTTGNLYGGSLGYRHENDLDWRLAHLPAPPISLLVTSSKIGEKTYPGTMAFLRLVHSPMQGYSLILAQGGHNFGSWQRELPQSLTWLGRRLRPAVPNQAQVLLHS
ncbi:MAG TPA: alpha/beta hydrolase-fold protein [Streptosporangiaceae bacterium]|nr:alpha/beta hydrolase-fold protein [Streptosporangiaceae bacterium]